MHVSLDDAHTTGNAEITILGVPATIIIATTTRENPKLCTPPFLDASHTLHIRGYLPDLSDVKQTEAFRSMRIEGG